MSGYLPDLWIIVTLLAAAFQTVRFMLQKVLATGTLSAAGATFSRFLYSAPFILILLALYLTVTDQAVPDIAPAFWVYGLVLGEGVSMLGFAAIALGVMGLLLLSGGAEAKGFSFKDFGNRAAGLGILSGFLFSISAVCYRGATLSIDADDPILRAAVTLGTVVVMQTLIMVIWLTAREPQEMARVWAARRVALRIGLTSKGGSFCWFVAFALQNAAYVKALGQVELILSVAATTLFFREKISIREWAGMSVLMGSIVMLVLVT